MAESLSELDIYADRLDKASQLSLLSAEAQQRYLHGDADTDVLTENGLLPTLAKQAVQSQEKVTAALQEVASQMAGAMTYSTVAKGLLATANGSYFSVPSASNDEYLVLYLNDQGTAVAKKTYPSADVVSVLRDLIKEQTQSVPEAYTFEDDFRNILMRLLGDGTLDLLGGQVRESDAGFEFSDQNKFLMARIGAASSYISGMYIQATDQDGFEWVDENNFIVGRVAKGVAYFGPELEQSSATPDIPLPEAMLDQQQRTQLIQIVGYGQSLSRGMNAVPALSIEQPYNNLMLAGGVKSRPGESNYISDSFAPLVESVYGSEGETPMSALCNGLVRRLAADGELPEDWVFVGASTGRGGRSVEQLSAAPIGQGYYETTVQTVRDSHAIAKRMGKTYSVWAYTWDQGESNYVNGSNKSAYQYTQNMMSIFDGLTREFVRISGQPFRPYVFTYQVGAHKKYSLDNMSIALAQWRLSRQRPDVCLAVPVYILPTGDDVLHLTNEGSWLLGEYRSRAMHETMIRRSGKWRPLEPVSIDWRPAYLDIKFHVPRGELVLDYALAAAAPNFGFDIRESGSLVNIINTVEVVAPDTVRIELSRPAAADAVVSYGRGRPGDPAASGPATGARGNLRDTHGLYDTVVSPNGKTFALHNPCVMFQYDRKTGF